ncbi:MAG: ATP-binding cassette domain-containing protein, partial [Pseudomonadota bacterium]
MLKLERIDIRNGDFRLSADLSVARGQIVAVIGPSGAGKTTLIEAIAGFRDVHAGTIAWAGRDITSQAPGARPVAMLFQDGNLFPHLSALENVQLGVRPRGRATPSDRAAADAALARVGLTGMGNRKPSELSGGQQSRVALARALVQRRDLLLLDEPFSALGPALRAEMLDLVADLQDETGVTVLMISHAPEDARRIAGQAILVAGGQAGAPVATN